MVRKALSHLLLPSFTLHLLYAGRCRGWIVWARSASSSCTPAQGSSLTPPGQGRESKIVPILQKKPLTHTPKVTQDTRVKKCESLSGVSDSWRPHGLHSPRNSPGTNTGVGSLSLLQGIFPSQRSNPGLPHCRQILYQLSHKEASRWRNHHELDVILVQGPC